MARSEKARDAKEGLGKLTEGIWKPRWLGDDDTADKMDKVDPTPDELYEAELSREKFLGRLAVIGLGVRSPPPPLHIPLTSYPGCC